MRKSTVILSFIATVGLFSATLPKAASILEMLNQDSVEPETPYFVLSDYLEAITDATTAEERIVAWVNAYHGWTDIYAQSTDWQEQEKMQSVLVELGSYFPAQTDWSILKDELRNFDLSGENDALNVLIFLVALLENDETAALEILKSELSASALNSSNGDGGGFFSALLSVTTGSFDMQQEPPMVQIAIAQDGMPELQKVAYEIAISDAVKNGYYYGNIPDLTQLYADEELDSRLEEFLKVIGDHFRPYSLPDPVIPAIYAYYRANDLVPHEDFLDLLKPTSPTYQDDVNYFEKKHGERTQDEKFFRASITRKLKAGDMEGAWMEWEAFAKMNARDARAMLQSIFGYQSRNFPFETLKQFALRVLELSENPELIDILQSGLPLETNEKDALLSRVRRLKAATDNPKLKAAYAKVELDRLLAIGLKEPAIVAAENFLASPGQVVAQLVADGNIEELIRYANAFQILGETELETRFIQLSRKSAVGLDAYLRSSLAESLANYYIDKKDYAAAFETLQGLLEGVSRKSIIEGDADVSQTLALMLELYTRTGQHNDAILLLDEAIGWQAKDLLHLRYYNENQNFKVSVAEAFHALGHSDLALDILKDHLRYVDNADDLAYQLLLEIKGPAAMDFLKELASEAPFEERPLIWQSVLLKEANDLQAAEAMARKAISIDPTDGEMSSINRLRAYAVLGDILKARDDEEAIIFERIVAAVNLSEVADEYRVAGLFSHALKLYQESMALFADAYCVRFRAAVELEAAGQHDQAEEHFEAAYTLMPDQFGRIESHCFGCEGAFQGERAQSIAERVFARMLQERPEQASLHYLMGYLNSSREQNEQALENFQRAVQIDPLYYNAWSKIHRLAENSGQIELSLEAATAMLEIAPRRSIGLLQNGSVQQLGELWETGEQLLPIMPKRAESLYPLKASAELNEAGNHFRYYGWAEFDMQSMGSLLFSNDDVFQYLIKALNNNY
ncbi:MAG: hypothetical protein AAF065_12950 [Verrucomicrobiota bacterium]